ncbi:AAA family ATPase [Syntrophothermus lipocalidus]|uniref:AAA ATPase central domain protein n=1 Tax=Syntrophothermus lipocalidus (strain DSM 12680 / TGB-C1) TaxID=643648 RepID=D7CMC3_SYNLT|nr:AAA family ATPase [Syntrophothermus lipocalidus]ADI01858.1 AAA ATPase central domain protein [Syntrophothermus lipocalidus DSM 12680]
MEISLRFAQDEKISGARSDQFQVFLPSLSVACRRALAELDSMVGLEEVKKLVRELIVFTVIQKKRLEQNLKAQPMAMHMVMKGNPGTGKTTVARILGKIYRELGTLAKGHLVEVERADLVGEYIGHTAQKTREQIKRAQGGILFIDEAYTLAQGGSRDFGRESIATLVKAMEDHRDELVVILAGYRDEMEFFLKANPGLYSRFPIQVEFPDYSSEELFEIALNMFAERDYLVSSRARWKLKHLLSQFHSSGRVVSGNARFVRNLVEKSIRWQALRLAARPVVSRQELMMVESEDLPDMV